MQTTALFQSFRRGPRLVWAQVLTHRKQIFLDSGFCKIFIARFRMQTLARPDVGAKLLHTLRAVELGNAVDIIKHSHVQRKTISRFCFSCF